MAHLIGIKLMICVTLDFQNLATKKSIGLRNCHHDKNNNINTFQVLESIVFQNLAEKGRQFEDLIFGRAYHFINIKSAIYILKTKHYNFMVKLV
jgi:hypothetical protein